MYSRRYVDYRFRAIACAKFVDGAEAEGERGVLAACRASWTKPSAITRALMRISRPDQGEAGEGLNQPATDPVSRIRRRNDRLLTTCTTS